MFPYSGKLEKPVFANEKSNCDLQQLQHYVTIVTLFMYIIYVPIYISHNFYLISHNSQQLWLKSIS